MKTATSVIVIALLAVAPAPAQQPVRITGMFSDMRYVAEAGDLERFS